MDWTHSEVVVTTADLVAIMLCKRLTFAEICAAIESTYPSKIFSRRVIRSRIVNLKDSKHAIIHSEKDMKEEGGKTYWTLVSVESCYFRRVSLTRGGAPRKDPNPPYIRPRPPFSERELESCRLAHLFDFFLRNVRSTRNVQKIKIRRLSGISCFYGTDIQRL